MYNHQEIDAQWQNAWVSQKTFATPSAADPRPKMYILDMFPYPSGSGLHVGHLFGYMGSDVLARTARMQGKAVLHPMGWDAFGLPAENFAIKTGVHPALSTKQNAAAYRTQLQAAGLSYDWDREIDTSDPEYYKWTQWLFQLLYKRGLAYRKEGLVNWCPKCQTVLANEQVVGGQCERCQTVVIQRNLEQWYFKITDYAQRLIDDIETVDWPERIKAIQRNWIGRSEGAHIPFSVVNDTKVLTAFTTRPDTLFGVSYVVIAPEHQLLDTLAPESHKEAIATFRAQIAQETELERTQLVQEKRGVDTGIRVLHPITKQELPVWTADYVLATYGTGVVMGVPAHDERDAAFAEKYGLPSTVVLDGEPFAHAGAATLLASGDFTSKQNTKETMQAITKVAGGEWTITYRLRDWLVSRQRFWGAPIPMRSEVGTRNLELVPSEQLPVELPMDVDFLPTGQSPLAVADHWRLYEDGGTTYEREADTLDTFVCSSWYFLRFCNPHTHDQAFDPEAVKHWMPVDMYIGGAEHAAMHLLYARFITKVLFDEGLVPFKEPFQTLRNQGMILGPDHQKMSKSKGNVISAAETIAEYGADTFRTYELFMGPYDQEKPWSTTGIVGVRRFLEKVWALQEKAVAPVADETELHLINQAIAAVTTEIEATRFNTAIAKMMECVNALGKQFAITRDTYEKLLLILNPFAPHFTEELWHTVLGHADMCSLAEWPSVDERYLQSAAATYAVQINGKTRGTISMATDASETEVVAAAKEEQNVARYLTEGEVVKTIFVPGRVVSFVVK
jgi:leucyl-tRNA synthetase